MVQTLHSRAALIFFSFSYALPPGWFLANELRLELLRSCNAGSECRLQYMIVLEYCNTIPRGTQPIVLCTHVSPTRESGSRPTPKHALQLSELSTLFLSLPRPSDYLTCANKKNCTAKPCNQETKAAAAHHEAESEKDLLLDSLSLLVYRLRSSSLGTAADPVATVASPQPRSSQRTDGLGPRHGRLEKRGRLFLVCFLFRRCRSGLELQSHPTSTTNHHDH
ncbi:hypothetical protein V8C44DRAFT_342436 [Trichoderma aethiopicum]